MIEIFRQKREKLLKTHELLVLGATARLTLNITWSEQSRLRSCCEHETTKLFFAGHAYPLSNTVRPLDLDLQKQEHERENDVFS